MGHAELVATTRSSLVWTAVYVALIYHGIKDTSYGLDDLWHRYHLYLVCVWIAIFFESLWLAQTRLDRLLCIGLFGCFRFDAYGWSSLGTS